MAEIIVRDDESIDASLRRFARLVQNDGILREAKRRRFYEKPSDKRRREHAQALRKILKRKRRAEARVTGRPR